ncbi:MAG: hypothetical protein IBX61_04590 [Thermoleophilia bacterium]|nr:hypothetical protein [Thermoleophilia bacterium]
MKAVSYVTLLEGLLATSIYHPHKPGNPKSAPFFWSAPLCPQYGTSAGPLSTTATWIPCFQRCMHEDLEEQGMRTSATPVGGYRIPLRGR